MLLKKEVIQKIDKTTIMAHFTRYIRLWYISDQLPQWMIEDNDIIPYFTPCAGHRMSYDFDDSKDYSEIDGVLPMRAFCSICREKSM